MKRRTLLSRLGGIGAVTTVAGCLTGGGDTTETGDSGEQETLASATSETTRAETTSGGSTESGGEATATATATDGASADVDFETAVDNIEKCSKTCRTLTYAVQNRGSENAPDVVVRIQVFTGGEQIWDENQSVGSIESQSQRTGISRDIDVGLFGGRKIQNNDGEVTIKLTPEAAGVSETFTYERTLDV